MKPIRKPRRMRRFEKRHERLVRTQEPKALRLVVACEHVVDSADGLRCPCTSEVTVEEGP